MLYCGHPIGQAVIFCSCGFFFFFLLLLLFYLAYSRRSQIGYLAYFHTWCGLSANLEWRSEICCTRLTENTGCKNMPSAHHRTTLSGYIFATKACIDNPKKLAKQQYLLHMCSQYGELQPSNDWDWLASFGHPSKCQRVLHLGLVIFAIWSITFNRWHHIHSAGWSSRWVSAHILVLLAFLLCWLFCQQG